MVQFQMSQETEIERLNKEAKKSKKEEPGFQIRKREV